MPIIKMRMSPVLKILAPLMLNLTLRQIKREMMREKNNNIKLLFRDLELFYLMKSIKCLKDKIVKEKEYLFLVIVLAQINKIIKKANKASLPL
jgi:hypothetical protein